MHEVILITVSGRDQPGITAALTGVLAHYEVSVLDIGQSVIHDTLALGLLVEMPQEVAGGAADLPMLSIARLGDAFHAKPVIKRQAQHSIATLGLDAIFYLLGMRERDIGAGA